MSEPATSVNRPLVLTPRIVAVALIAQAILQRWVDSAAELAAPLRVALFGSLAGLGAILLVGFSIITLRIRHRWLIAGFLAWTVGWLATTADLGALLVWSLGAPYPAAPHQVPLDAELVQLIATAGGLAIGAALVTAIREPRFRHSAMILLAGFAVFSLIAAVEDHRIALAASLPDIVALRKDRDLAAAIANVALAGVLWMYWRRVVAIAA
jgi:asparagine N-glycosylation enzyme membrane subunit Stt3